MRLQPLNRQLIERLMGFLPHTGVSLRKFSKFCPRFLSLLKRNCFFEGSEIKMVFNFGFSTILMALYHKKLNQKSTEVFSTILEEMSIVFYSNSRNFILTSFDSYFRRKKNRNLRKIYIDGDFKSIYGSFNSFSWDVHRCIHTKFPLVKLI